MTRTKATFKERPKYTEDNPTIRAIRQYEREIAELEEKRDKANEEQDWTMRHWYSNQIAAKTKNMEILQEKVSTKRLGRRKLCPSLCE